jgi:hypothetical protein
MIALVWLVCIAFSLTARSAVSPSDRDSDVHARGRVLTQWLLSGNAERLYELMSSELRSTVGGQEGLMRLVRQLEQQAGKEIAVVREAAYHERGRVDYYRISRFSLLPHGTITIRWVWEPGGPIVGAKIAPTPDPAPTEHLDYRTKTALELPFNGVWYVAWGGRLPHQNYTSAHKLCA